MATEEEQHFEARIGQWQKALDRRISDELRDQHEKWGNQAEHSPEFWYVIAAEEFGEIAQAILKKDIIAISTETVQLMAVLVRLVERSLRIEGTAL